MASKGLLLYATDTYKLSSLLLQRVIFSKPATLEAYREKTRQLLLDQSRPAVVNEAAVKLLEWDREWNSIQYYGVEAYAKRWWTSRSWSLFPISNGSASTSVGGSGRKHLENLHSQGEKANNKNVARVAFMITSNQRRKLSTQLGFDSVDIRSFKPIEALLLLEHNVRKDSGDFRIKLKQLVEENEQLTKNQHQTQSQQPLENINEVEGNQRKMNEDGSRTETPVQPSISPDEAERIHAKPDVALALLSVDKQESSQTHEATRSGDKGGHDLISSNGSAEMNSAESVDEPTPSVADDPLSTSTVAPPSSPAIVNDITPHDSEKLHMKADVAAAIINSQQQNEQQRAEQQVFVNDQEEGGDDNDGDGPCWYEVIERLPTKLSTSGAGFDAMNGEQVIALFPTEKEAIECARLKQSLFRSSARNIASNGDGSSNDIFLVRRRWNV